MTSKILFRGCFVFIILNWSLWLVLILLGLKGIEVLPGKGLHPFSFSNGELFTLCCISPLALILGTTSLFFSPPKKLKRLIHLNWVPGILLSIFSIVGILLIIETAEPKSGRLEISRKPLLFFDMKQGTCSTILTLPSGEILPGPQITGSIPGRPTFVGRRVHCEGVLQSFASEVCDIGIQDPKDHQKFLGGEGMRFQANWGPAENFQINPDDKYEVLIKILCKKKL